MASPPKCSVSLLFWGQEGISAGLQGGDIAPSCQAERAGSGAPPGRAHAPALASRSLDLSRIQKDAKDFTESVKHSVLLSLVASS